MEVDTIDEYKYARSGVPPPIALRCKWPHGGGCLLASVRSWFSSNHMMEQHPIRDELKMALHLEDYCIGHLLGCWYHRKQCRFAGCSGLISFCDLALDVGIMDKCILTGCQSSKLPHDFVHSRMACCPVPDCKSACLDTRGVCAKGCSGACVSKDKGAVSLFGIYEAHRSVPLPYCFQHLGVQRNDLVRRYNVMARTSFDPSKMHLTGPQVEAQLQFDEFRPPCPAVDVRMCRVQGCDLPPASTIDSRSPFAREFQMMDCKSERTHEWFHKKYDTPECVASCESPFCDRRGPLMRLEASINTAEHIETITKSGIVPMKLRNFTRMDTDGDRRVCAFHAWKHPRDHPKICVVADCVNGRDKGGDVFCHVHTTRARRQATVEWLRLLELHKLDQQQQQQQAPVAVIQPLTQTLVRRQSFNNSIVEQSKRLALLMCHLAQKTQAAEEQKRRDAGLYNVLYDVSLKHHELMDRIIHNQYVPSEAWNWIRSASAADHAVAGTDAKFLSDLKGSDKETIKRRKALEMAMPSAVAAERDRDVRAAHEPVESFVSEDPANNWDTSAGHTVNCARLSHEELGMDDRNTAEESSSGGGNRHQRIANTAFAKHIDEKSESKAVNVPLDAFDQLRPFLDSTRDSSVSNIDATRKSKRGAISDFESNPFLIFMSTMLAILERMRFNVTTPIYAFNAMGWSSRLPVGESLTVLPLLFQDDDLVAARRVVISYCCMLARGRHNGRSMTITGCFPECNRSRAAITSRRHESMASRKPPSTQNKHKLNVMPDRDDDILQAYKDVLESHKDGAMTISSATSGGAGVQAADTLFALIYASMIDRGRCPPTNLYVHLTMLYYEQVSSSANHTIHRIDKDKKTKKVLSRLRLYGIDEKDSERKMATKFYERVQLVSSVIRGALIDESDPLMQERYSVRPPTSINVNEACLRWMVWLYETPARRAVYVRTRYIQTTDEEHHPFPHSTDPDLGTALGVMWDQLHQLFHATTLSADHAALKHMPQQQQGCSVQQLLLVLLRKLFEPKACSNIEMLSHFVLHGRWPVTIPKLEDEQVLRSIKKMERVNKTHSALELPDVELLERVEPKTHRVGTKKKRGKRKHASDSDDDEEEHKSKKDVPMVYVSVAQDQLPKRICGFVQLVDSLEAIERALSTKLNANTDVHQAHAVLARAEQLFDTTMCGTGPDKTVVAWFFRLVCALRVVNGKRQKKEIEEAVEIATPDDCAFGDYWMGNRSLNGTTAVEQKSVLVPSTGVWQAIRRNEFWSQIAAVIVT